MSCKLKRTRKLSSFIKRRALEQETWMKNSRQNQALHNEDDSLNVHEQDETRVNATMKSNLKVIQVILMDTWRFFEIMP